MNQVEIYLYTLALIMICQFVFFSGSLFLILEFKKASTLRKYFMPRNEIMKKFLHFIRACPERVI